MTDGELIGPEGNTVFYSCPEYEQISIIVQTKYSSFNLHLTISTNHRQISIYVYFTRPEVYDTGVKFYFEIWNIIINHSPCNHFQNINKPPFLMILVITDWRLPIFIVQSSLTLYSQVIIILTHQSSMYNMYVGVE